MSDRVEVFRLILRAIFEEAKANGSLLKIDAATDKMWAEVPKLVGNPGPRIAEEVRREASEHSLKSEIALLRKIYHCAVDEFFKSYFTELSKPGRPRLGDECLAEVAELRRQNLSHSQIAEMLDPEGRAAKDKYRKRIRIAAKRKKPPEKTR